MAVSAMAMHGRKQVRRSAYLLLESLSFGLRVMTEERTYSSFMELKPNLNSFIRAKEWDHGQVT